jgi:hypothetical protein
MKNRRKYLSDQPVATNSGQPENIVDLQDKNGVPIPVKSYNFWIYVREGEGGRSWWTPGAKPRPLSRQHADFCPATCRNAVRHHLAEHPTNSQRGRRGDHEKTFGPKLHHQGRRECRSLDRPAGNELWATGEFRETGQGKNSEPLPIKGYWACIYVREGDDWKIGWPPGTSPGQCLSSSTRVLHDNRPQRRPQPPTLATNKLATDAGRGDNEKMLSISSRIGNQLCFADL